MEKKSFFKGTLLGLILSTVILISSTAFINKYDAVEKKLYTIEAAIDRYYVGKTDRTKMEEGIYKGFVAGVGDPYTSYFPKDEFKEYMEKTSGIYAGIGVTMSIDTNEDVITVVEVFKGSPAEKVGILPQDRIIKANGTVLTSKDFDTAPKIIKGTPGTQVDVTIFRPSENKTYDLKITRESITYPSVEHELLEDGIGYIKIKQFEELTYDQFKIALDDVTAKKAKGIVLDLRNNGGGLLDVTEKIVDELIPKGVIVSTKNNQDKVDVAYSDDKYNDIPMVVLVNEQSASASEVLSGALKDHKRAKLVGTTTFGKGIVQTILPINDGSALKVTMAQYFTPSGICIQGTGIDPDVKVELPANLLIKGKLEKEEDTQLQKGLAVLKQEIK